jgi:hypothetical protein
MYIKRIQLSSIKSIDQFEMKFDRPAGWHVLIGENGAGKTSALRAISLGLIGPSNIQVLRLTPQSWVQKGSNEADIKLTLTRGENDLYDDKAKISLKDDFLAQIKFSVDTNLKGIPVKVDFNKQPYLYAWGDFKGWFSVGYGPNRKINAKDDTIDQLFQTYSKAASHASIFGEIVAFTDILEWLSLLRYQTYENKPEAELIIASITRLINDGDLLPNDTKLYDIASDGVTFKDGNNAYVDMTQLSEGYRSVLSLLFELMKQFIRNFGAERVFRNFSEDKFIIDLEGVVLIDEIDEHLHPTWQTKIGDWFTTYFPNIQFIVTTHSPLVCRASEKGSIWFMTAPGNEVQKVYEIKGADRDRLIYGNILDAYGTEKFGANVDISEDAVKQKEELAALTQKQLSGKLTAVEHSKLLQLRQTFFTDAPVTL